MNLFEINKDALRKAWSVEEYYWFSLNDYKIKDVATLTQIDIPENTSRTAYLVSLGYIPFVSVSNIEVMRAFLQTITNTKLKDALLNVSDEEFVENFWKYHDKYSEIQNGYNEFEEHYVIEKTKRWCEENAVKYTM